MIIDRLPVTFTTPSPQKIQTGLGVAGFTHRYTPNGIAGAVGAVVTSWADDIGTKPLAGTNGPTVRALADARKYLEFDGVNDVIKNDAMPAGEVGTVIMIARNRATDSATTIMASGTGVSINRAGTSGTMLNPGTGVVNATKLDNQWRFVAAVATAAAASLTIDAVKATATAGGTWGTNLRIGANGSPNFWSQLDIVDMVTYATALSDADIATIRTAMKSSYPTLLL
ncbi:hypothetical protein R4P47_08140 [Rhodococcus sp. IEGM 1370]|uniref:hypothetical protein n=1 Tax=Rhodococcus sp. IEGM 1370 TaxID=3082222 RepID=UPI002952AE78|nr:hypothetical protein [Rhodococcus sp. IEGM 1370]MDV8076524.1 hypothetical protein [Rhodococcus sp. IEGM 1370]